MYEFCGSRTAEISFLTMVYNITKKWGTKKNKVETVIQLKNDLFGPCAQNEKCNKLW